MHPFLNTAVKAAREAGKIILRNMDRLDRVDIQRKEGQDFVTTVDTAAEDVIIDTILKIHPNHSILGEESGSINGSEDFQWIIDPIDGTTNFIHGYPQFCVSIGIARGHTVEHGVIYDPLRDELYTASKGGGARMNEKRIRVSSASKLQDALLGTGFSVSSFDNLDDLLAVLKEVIPQCHGIRRAGSAALDLAHVAHGRLDGYWEEGLKPWDIAAGSLLIREAGGLVSDYHGADEYLGKGHIVCGTPRVYVPLLKLIKAHSNV